MQDAKTTQTINIPAAHSRFQDALWYNPDFVIRAAIGGVGGIGSWLTLMLSRAGFKLILYDFDTIDETNMAGQLYPTSAIGGTKTRAITGTCRDFGCENEIIAFGAFTAISHGIPIMFSAFDNMGARKLFFESWKKQKERQVYIDGRMLAESGQVFFVTPGREAAYEEQLFADGEVKDQPCSMKATSHCGAHIASIMMAGFTNWITNTKLAGDIREVPFKIEFELPLLNWTLKTQEECKQLSKPLPTSVERGSEKILSRPDLLAIVQE